jgi:hypothetical protein
MPAPLTAMTAAELLRFTLHAAALHVGTTMG